MTSIFEGPPGSTPLDADEQDDLIPTWIATQGDLNSAEQGNVARATAWVSSRRLRAEDVLTQDWLKNLHKRMLGDVWRWAGGYRRRDTNIGNAWFEVPTSVEALIADVRAQVADDATGALTADEIAIRFHHRLVSIHPFVTGNGRHALLAADVLVEALGRQRFSWGRGSDLVKSGAARDRYLRALKTADHGDLKPLLAFAREDQGL